MIPLLPITQIFNASNQEAPPDIHPTSFRRQLLNEATYKNSYISLLPRDVIKHFITPMLDSSIDEAIQLNCSSIRNYIKNNINQIQRSEYESFVGLIQEALKKTLIQFDTAVKNNSPKSFTCSLYIDCDEKFMLLVRKIFEDAFDIRSTAKLRTKKSAVDPKFSLFPQINRYRILFSWNPANTYLYPVLAESKKT